MRPPSFGCKLRYVTATTVDFTFAVDELSNVSYVVLPRGAVEPTPLEVQAGTGAAGVLALWLGVLRNILDHPRLLRELVRVARDKTC